jgi:hypothetical protein
MLSAKFRYPSNATSERQFAGLCPKHGSANSWLPSLRADSFNIGRKLWPIAFEAGCVINNRATLMVYDDEAICALGDQIDYDALTPTVGQFHFDWLFDVKTWIAKLCEGLPERLRLLRKKLDLSLGDPAMLPYPVPQI